PMLVARPDLRFVLVERRSSRAGLLRGAVRRLGVEDRAVVVEVDVRRLPAEWRDQRFGTARCAGSESELLRMVRPLMAPGGLLVLSVRAGSAAVDVPGWDPPEAITVDRWT